MGLIYTGNNEIVTLYQAYGLTVNGIIHDYVWTIYENKREKCYTYVEEMRCFPKSEDCEKEYDLMEQDLYTKARCDFAEKK